MGLTVDVQMRRARRSDDDVMWRATLQTVWDDIPEDERARLNRGKWEATWLRNEPPSHAYRPRDEAKARLEKTRTPGTRPSLPLEKYVGVFESKLYGRLVVRHEGGRLSVTFGEFTTDLSHWQDEAFYARAPTRLSTIGLRAKPLSSTSAS